VMPNWAPGDTIPLGADRSLRLHEATLARAGRLPEKGSG
jgi:hypothetical protein